MLTYQPFIQYISNLVFKRHEEIRGNTEIQEPGEFRGTYFEPIDETISGNRLPRNFNRCIIKASGLTKGALYWHFESKEDPLKSIIKEFGQRYLDKLIRIVKEVHQGTLDKVEKYIGFDSSFASYNQELCVSFETLAAELIGAHHRVEAEFRRIYKKW